MQNVAAGLLMYRVTTGAPDYFLVHPGGPYFKNKDVGIWTIPKGIPEENEDLLGAAQREFFEETGIQPKPPYRGLGSITQKGGKQVHAWAFEGDWDPADGITCNTFTIEWPPRSGKKVEFPEVDKGQWFEFASAIAKINPAQIPFLERVRDLVSIP